MMQYIDIVHEKFALIASMMEITTIEYGIFCSQLVLDALVTTVDEHAEPLPEPIEDVKAFISEHERLIPQMIPNCHFLFPQDDNVYVLPQTDVDEDDWTDRIQDMIETDQILVDAFNCAAAPDPIPWDEIAQNTIQTILSQ